MGRGQRIEPRLLSTNGVHAGTGPEDIAVQPLATAAAACRRSIAAFGSFRVEQHHAAAVGQQESLLLEALHRAGDHLARAACDAGQFLP